MKTFRPVSLIVALGLFLAGCVVTVIALLADKLKIGTGQGFGYYQMIVLIIGIVTMLLGLALLTSRPKSPRGRDESHPR